jgi:CBS domain-containing protein
MLGRAEGDATMNISQVLTRRAITVSPAAPLSEAAELMCERHVGAIVVTETRMDEPVVVGVITDRDIVQAQLERSADLSRLRVGDVMHRDPLVLREDEPVSAAIRKMKEHGVRRAPVISSSGALTGVVSTDDLLAQVAEELSVLAYLVSHQPGREMAGPQRRS